MFDLKPYKNYQNFLGYMCTPHLSFILFFENVYLTLNIIFYKSLYTESLQWPIYFDIYIYT